MKEKAKDEMKAKKVPNNKSKTTKMIKKGDIKNMKASNMNQSVIYF